MDNDNAMMMKLLLQDEANVAAGQEQHIMVLTTLLHYGELLNIVPRRGGSGVRKEPNKDHHRQASALFLDFDYFVDTATSSPKEFWHHFRMSKELFMWIVFGIIEYDDYFMCKKDSTKLWGFSSVHRCPTVHCQWSSSRYII
jgi:hypothetical protein